MAERKKIKIKKIKKNVKINVRINEKKQNIRRK